MFWGSKKTAGETILLLDVESGSVGVALARLEQDRLTRLFGLQRRHVSVLRTVSAAALAQKVIRAVRELLQYTSMVTARVRSHERLRAFGEISRVEVFLSPPWTTLEGSQWLHENDLVRALAEELAGYFGIVPLAFHPVGRPLVSVVRGLFPEEEQLLVVGITGEVVELLHSGPSSIMGRATVPVGHHHFLRTLISHGGFTEAEARSLLSLPHATPASEALGVASRHFVQEFRDAAAALVQGNIQLVIIVAHEPVGDWCARILSDDSLEDLFPNGGVVRALRSHHLCTFLDAPRKDLQLMLYALFVESLSSTHRQVAV